MEKPRPRRVGYAVSKTSRVQSDELPGAKNIEGGRGVRLWVLETFDATYSNVFMDVIKYIKENYHWEQGENFIRVEGVVDIYKRSKKKKKISVFVLPEKKYYYAINDEELSDIVFNHVDHYIENKHLTKSIPKIEHPGFEMTFGIHKGKNIKDVPVDYLLWLYDNGKCFGKVKNYIEQNESTLRNGKRK